MHNYCHLEQKNQMICIFAVILICLLPSDHAVDKMSVGHTNKNEMYILYFILFENEMFENEMYILYFILFEN